MHMYSWGAQASLTRSFTQVIPALGSLVHTMLANPSFSVRPTPLPQEELGARTVSADTTVYTPIPPPGSVNVPVSEFPSGTTRGSARLEKYDEELPELKRYWKKFISNIQQTTVNLNSHIRYLELVMQDKSLYPNWNVILATRWIQRLRDKKRDDLADWFLVVIDKGFGSHSPRGFLQLDDPVMKPLYFVRCLMRSDGTVIDATDKNNRDDQNIGLHDLASKPSMRRLATSQKITVNSCRLLTSIDTEFCPFCDYHASCHKTLNNHILIHLSLLLFCGFPGCFYTSSDCKAMFQHAIRQHQEYVKSKELYPKDG